MAGGNKKSAALIRSAYVRKCLVSNELYTLYFGNKKCETIMELPKTWFYGVKCPKKGSKITIIQEVDGRTRMLINNEQFYPSLHPLSRTKITPKK